MVKRSISYVVLAFIFSAPVAASAEEGKCIPLTEISERLDAAGVSPSDFVAISSEELPAAYAKAAGFAVPDDSHPIGISFLSTPSGILVSFIEPELCIKYAIPLTLKKHNTALRASTRGA